MNEAHMGFIRGLKKIVPDNDKRDSAAVSPCIIVSHTWGKSEIDGQPDDFDWKEFWRVCKEEYPLHSICGGAPFKNEKAIKEVERYYAKRAITDVPKNRIDPQKRNKPLVLEIGYGFGAAAKTFYDAGYRYYGIDYISSGKPNKRYGKFIEIDKSGIPESLLSMEKKFDLVYSSNVFQHLTSKQRLEYYKQSYDALKSGGLLHFSLFTRNEAQLKKFFSDPLEGDKCKNYATIFFDVFTSVPHLKKVLNNLRKIGFEIKSIYKRRTGDVRTNWTEIIAKKK